MGQIPSAHAVFGFVFCFFTDFMVLKLENYLATWGLG